MPAGTPVYPSSQNAYVPDHAATQGLIVDFSRAPSDFSLNEWIKVFPVKKERGLYAQFGEAGGLPSEAARITDTSMADGMWDDGNDRPSGVDFDELFAMVDFFAKRRAQSWRAGDKLVAQATWQVKDQKARMAAQRVMTWRCQAMITLATTTGNYPSGHSGAVTGLGSIVTGTWDNSTTARLDIRKSLDYACLLIFMDTLGCVRKKDLQLVMGPGCAAKVSRSQEIVDYLKGQEGSIRIITGKDTDEYKAVGDFQMPATLYGIKVVVEDSVKITSAKGATRVPAFIAGDTVAWLCARPGALIGTDPSAPNFSAFSLFVYDQEEMLVEEWHDDKNKRVEGSVIDTWDTAVTSGAAAFLFTGVTS